MGGYAGSQRCGQCHPNVYRSWQKTRHSFSILSAAEAVKRGYPEPRPAIVGRATSAALLDRNKMVQSSAYHHRMGEWTPFPKKVANCGPGHNTGFAATSPGDPTQGVWAASTTMHRMRGRLTGGLLQGPIVTSLELTACLWYRWCSRSAASLVWNADDVDSRMADDPRVRILVLEGKDEALLVDRHWFAVDCGAGSGGRHRRDMKRRRRDSGRRNQIHLGVQDQG